VIASRSEAFVSLDRFNINITYAADLLAEVDPRYP
jgi:hypothetical protein